MFFLLWERPPQVVSVEAPLRHSQTLPLFHLRRIADNHGAALTPPACLICEGTARLATRVPLKQYLVSCALVPGEVPAER